MTGPTSLALEIDRLLERIAPQLTTPALEAAAVTIGERLTEPIRVAIAGRVKAGKSTVLNALVGERLAPTDAGECTKIVTWYRHGMSYGVTAWFDDGTHRPVPFAGERDRLVLETERFDIARIERIDVTWPSQRLRRLTLIDTPGLESHDEVSSARTRRVLGLDDSHSEVDAVVYLMRHAHQLDVGFLEAFTDRSLANPSPVNAIGVLSRADEIGAGRPDALDSAAAAAERYASDTRIRLLCATVVPVAGLIAETGRTLLEHEGASLRAIAELPEAERRRMAMSVDRFTDPSRSPLDAATRRDLLLRLGMFGVRLGLEVMARPAATPSDLARSLVEASRIDRLSTLVEDHFGRRADLLKARSALANFKALIAQLPDSAEVTGIRNELERVEAAASELGEMRLLQLMISGAAEFDDEQSREVHRLTTGRTPEHCVGLEAGATREELLATIVGRVEVWRRNAAFALASAEQREACEIVASEYERLYAELSER